jgi:hypothetical protein
MSEKNEKDAAGKALYLEFRKNEYTYQFILTPALTGRSTIEEPHKPYLLMRRISSFHPRRNWGFYSGSKPAGLVRHPDGTFLQLESSENLVSIIGEQSSVFKSYAGQLGTRGYKLHKNPIFVEVSFKDLDAIKTKKTPNDLYRRILRSRETFDFGEVVTPVAA